MKKVWKSKDPEERNELLKEILADDNTAEFRKIYSRVLEEIKTWAPNIDTLSYHEWTPEVKTRVENWIKIVLEGNDPRTVTETPVVAATVTTPSTMDSTGVMTSTAKIDTGEDTDDLPF